MNIPRFSDHSLCVIQLNVVGTTGRDTIHEWRPPAAGKNSTNKKRTKDLIRAFVIFIRGRNLLN